MSEWLKEYRTRAQVMHGTVAGYRRCVGEVRLELRESACDPCKAAWRSHRATRRENGLEDAGNGGERWRKWRVEDRAEDYEPRWSDDGACRQDGVDPEWFFTIDREDAPDMPTNQRRRRNRIARRKALMTCNVCGIREQCLKDNLDMPVGIVGGTTPWQRVKMRQENTTEFQPLFLEPV